VLRIEMVLTRLVRRKSHLLSLIISINLLIPLFLEVSFAQSSVDKSSSDNDFAEFEEEEEQVPRTGQVPLGHETPPATPPAKESEENFDDEVVVEDIEEEEEEEAFPRKKEPEPLKITNIPGHLLNNWDSYYAEILFALIIVLYFVNFIAGKSKNDHLANTWLEVNRPVLEANFALEGDDGKKEIENHGLMKDMENVFYIWSSGRVGIEGLLVELRLWRRHDLLSVMQKFLKPVNDQLVIKANLFQDSMDNFVLCLATKKTATKLVKEYPDISTFCPEKKSVDKFGLNPDKFVLMNEIGEAASNLFDKTTVAIFNKYEEYFDFIHVSDQFSGPKGSEYDPQPTKLPEVRKIAIFGLNCKYHSCCVKYLMTNWLL